MRRPKAAWPSGEWSQEPDEKRWEDRDTGLQCFAMRGPAGAWCGYVGVRDGHPAFGFSSTYDYSIDDVASGLAAKRVNVQKQVNDIEVHGGLTYSGTDKMRGEAWWWFGFDCSHAGDYCPSYEDIKQLGTPTGWGSVVEYRNLDYVTAQCAELAKQLGRISK